jgi:hypothetical protein
VCIEHVDTYAINSNSLTHLTTAQLQHHCSGVGVEKVSDDLGDLLCDMKLQREYHTRMTDSKDGTTKTRPDCKATSIIMSYKSFKDRHLSLVKTSETISDPHQKSEKAPIRRLPHKPR